MGSAYRGRRLGRVGIVLVVLGVVAGALLASSDFAGLYTPEVRRVPAISGGQIDASAGGNYLISLQGGPGADRRPIPQVIGPAPDYPVVAIRPLSAAPTRPSDATPLAAFSAGPSGRYYVELAGITSGHGQLVVTSTDGGGWLPVLGGILVGLVILVVGLLLMAWSNRAKPRSAG